MEIKGRMLGEAYDCDESTTRIRLLPFSECVALGKPPCGATVLSFACVMMIDGSVWGK